VIPSISLSSQSYLAALESAPKMQILVVGDLMLDRYLWGKVERISPEAPVPVVEVELEENRLGGAANVALNLKALGAEPILCGVIGTDLEGDLFLEQLQLSGLSTQGIVRIAGRRTTAKIRIIGNQHQMLRVDKEIRTPLQAEEAQQVLAQIKLSLPQVQGVIFEDYDKGLLDSNLIQKIQQAFAPLKIPVLVDPKYRNFFYYPGCTVFKPNLKELREGLNLPLHKDDYSGLQQAVLELRKTMPHSWTLLTLSENGMFLLDEAGKGWRIPAHERKIADVSGAGDTVISVLTYAHLLGLSIPESAALANLAGGMVCEFPGVVPIEKEELVNELNRLQKLELIPV
jgi:rfaE bifunctional protein kinase chain/domain